MVLLFTAAVAPMPAHPPNWPAEDPLAGPRAAVEADLKLHESYRVAYSLFFDLLAEASADKAPHILDQLRQQPVYQMAEFFYLLKAYRLDGAEQLRGYIDLHNQQLKALIEDRARLRLYGFGPSRLQKALIDEPTAAKMIVNYTHFDGAFDQSDLARLVVEVMAPETCRKTVVTLADAGLLRRSAGVYNAVIVRSPGMLERIFAQHVRAFRTRFTSKVVPELEEQG